MMDEAGHELRELTFLSQNRQANVIVILIGTTTIIFLATVPNPYTEHNLRPIIGHVANV